MIGHSISIIINSGKNIMTAIRRSASLFFINALVALATLFHTGTASAACPTVTVINNTSSTIRLCLVEPTGARRCFSFPVGVTPGVPVMDPVAALSNAGTTFPLSPCTPCIRVPAPMLVCATICYDAVNCIVTVNPCPGPCIP